jgi:hypothetical protein
MFQLSHEEWEYLKSQFATSINKHGGRRKIPFVFTKQRVAMLAALGLPIGEEWHPMNSRLMGAGIYHFQEAQNLVPGFWIPPMICIFLAEIRSINEVNIIHKYII